MNSASFTRRQVVRSGFVGLGAVALGRISPSAFGADAVEEGQLVPFIDPQPIDAKRPMVKWEDLREWITPDNQIFAVSHYGTGKVNLSDWKLKIEGRVEKPVELSLDQIKARPATTLAATLECSGNGSTAGFMGAVGNANWTGTSLASLLAECGIKPEAIEVAFWGADVGKETIRNKPYQQNFARTLRLDQIKNAILAWDMNGKPLPAAHGAPLRLIVPGWYGIAWVKWLTGIELRDRPLMNRFTARDYVTLRGHKNGDSIEYSETAVGPMQVKSLVGRVTKQSDGSLHLTGAAWSREPIGKVELRVDNSPWFEADLLPRPAGTPAGSPAWTFWSYDWKTPTPGEHTIVSRATDAGGRVQPEADDDFIKLKQTYWEANQQYPRKIKI
ncbi:MAG TPA: molybdopterin-dependent oxidoreductase [Tepidisphaeraceae bacterium]|jgi:DMSO/TMAO reductase YedYZ molybdopterin-dependent catalytic subunit